MKTQNFSEEQLKDAVAGKPVVTIEAKKEGERLIPEWMGENVHITETIHNGKDCIYQVGEVVQAMNEKGEKQWFCPDCQNIFDKEEARLDSMESHDCECGYNSIFWKPLLVRLEKIEEDNLLNWYEKARDWGGPNDKMLIDLVKKEFPKIKELTVQGFNPETVFKINKKSPFYREKAIFIDGKEWNPGIWLLTWVKE